MLVGALGMGSAASGQSAATATISTGAGAGASNGGALAPGIPEIRDVVCLRGCVGLRAPVHGGVIQVSGRNLAQITSVSFRTADGRILSSANKATATTVTAPVPPEAVDGKVKVRDEFGNVSSPSPAPLDIHPRSELGTAGALEIAEAETTPAKAFFFGMRMPRLTYVVRSSQPLNDLRIDVVRRDGTIVRSFFRDDVEANSSQTIRWNGKTSAGKPAPGGGYAFRISSQAGALAKREVDGEGGGLGFKLYGHIFPVRGPHSYGDGIGAPREGHTHQGQDVFAACGTRLVAARGGRVEYNAYHSSAGYYVVIDGRNSPVDFVYMHLTGPSPAKAGRTVRTGQFIGRVGETGNASGCHLHYEMWSAPGWYQGGDFMDPAPPLRRWDRYS
jgi:murein DD-endopeptidase MepM/ murein hydrolase activator NlpD